MHQQSSGKISNYKEIYDLLGKLCKAEAGDNYSEYQYFMGLDPVHKIG
jgi:hypothetical protein